MPNAHSAQLLFLTFHFSPSFHPFLISRCLRIKMLEISEILEISTLIDSRREIVYHKMRILCGKFLMVGNEVNLTNSVNYFSGELA